ncbi:hypothetical protein GGI15_001533 [Coemansia interrupta]|uniref:Uncharacterized protein n=1 Tax=Coemansia interrupta TaxID=1126814 RepID=A0A9W8LMV5_9FUNG|nr:hypothetical protein GGI15_001533 [Coemansia interrupta]
MDDFISVIKRLKSPDTESFNDAVANNNAFSSGALPGRDVTVRTMRPSGEERFITIRTNDHYMPARRIYKGDQVTDRWTFEYF